MWDKILLPLSDEIDTCRGYLSKKEKIMIFEIRLGPGYLLYRCKIELTNIEILDCDIDMDIESLFTLRRRLLEVSHHTIELGVFK